MLQAQQVNKKQCHAACRGSVMAWHVALIGRASTLCKHATAMRQ